MERGLKATFNVQWPGGLSRFVVTLPRARFDEYANDQHLADTVINMLVDDMQLVMVNTARGLQSE